MRSLAFCLSLTPFLAVAAADVPPFYHTVAAEYSLPPVLLYSVAVTESGVTKLGVNHPWPWTVNDNGKGIYFDTRLDAYDYLSQILDDGHTNFDVGLMQVNWHWNHHLFSSLWDALDPYTNLRGGASLIQSHYQSLGSLEAAVGAYHSPSNAKRAKTYRERVRVNMADILR